MAENKKNPKNQLTGRESLPGDSHPVEENLDIEALAEFMSGFDLKAYEGFLLREGQSEDGIRGWAE